jgi:hypothetical protein
MDATIRDNCSFATRCDKPGESADVVLDFAGTTTNTTMTAVSVSFETGPKITIGGTPSSPPPPPPVPEPLTLSLFGAGLAGLIAMRRRRKATA